MAVEQLSSRAIQAIGASAGTDAASLLREGAVLEGRVVAINADDTLKVATRLGQLDVDPSLVTAAGGHGGRGRQVPSQALIGTTVKLEVGAQTSSSGRLLVRLVAGEDPQLAATQTAPDGLETADVGQRIAAEIARAAAQQDGLAPVFSTAAELQLAAGDLPEALTQALVDLGGFALSAGDFATPETLRAAFLKSGLFLESKLAQLAAGHGGVFDPSRPLRSQDLKAALLALKPALDDWLATQEAATGAGDTPTEQAGPRASATALATTTLAEAALAGLADAPVDTEALFAVLRPPPTASGHAAEEGSDAGQSLLSLALQTQQGTAAAGAASVAASETAMLATLGAFMDAAGLAAPASHRRGPYGGRPLGLGLAQRQSGDGMPATGRPPPPRRGSPPLGQAAVLPGRTSARDPLGLARLLSGQVANALARISLGQYASLHEPTLGGSHQPAQPHDETRSWLFEIPLALGPGVAIVPFEIDQVQQQATGTETVEPAWRVQFSLDAHDLGPVHARLVLGGDRLSVGLWAETAPGIATVSALLPALRRGLEDVGLTVTEIHFAPGRPPSGPPVRAGGFVDRNA